MTTQVESPVARTISLPEAGRILGIGTSVSYELARAGEFPVRVLRIGRKLRVSTQQLEAYLAGNEG